MNFPSNHPHIPSENKLGSTTEVERLHWKSALCTSNFQRSMPQAQQEFPQTAVYRLVKSSRSSSKQQTEFQLRNNKQDVIGATHHYCNELDLNHILSRFSSSSPCATEVTYFLSEERQEIMRLQTKTLQLQCVHATALYQMRNIVDQVPHRSGTPALQCAADNIMPLLQHTAHAICLLVDTPLITLHSQSSTSPK
jgi:hypothetical protein